MKFTDSLKWFLLACCGFTASMSIYTAEWLKEQPRLLPPLEQIRQSGRPISGGLVAILLVLALVLAQKNTRKSLVPTPILCLLFVQITLFVKSYLIGNFAAAMSGLALYGLVLAMVIWGPSRWLQTDGDFQGGAWSIAMVGVIFVLTNTYQYVIDRFPITFTNGYFMGTTGNPQHAAMLLVGVVPCVLFLFESTKSGTQKTAWLTLLLVLCVGLAMTASRTGAFAGVMAVLLFYRKRGGKFLQLALIASIILYIGFSLFHNPSDAVSPSLLSKGAADTRSAVWSEQIEKFLQNPLFGAPLVGERVAFNESSWLGIAAGAGVIGLLPLLMFGYSTLKMMLKLDRFSKQYPQYYLHCSAVIAGLGAMLAGSFTEAYLLGILTFSILAVLQYLVLGQYLCELSQRFRRLKQHEAYALSSLRGSYLRE